MKALTDEAQTATRSHDTFAVLRAPRKLIFGAGRRHESAAVVAELGQSVLICTDKRMSADPSFEVLLKELRELDLHITVFDAVEAELPVESIVRSVSLGGTSRPDTVLAIGGGSCIDHAKITAILLSHGGHPRDYYGEMKVPGEVVPIIAIPTTAGTGAETTPVAVLTDGDRATKVGISSPFIIPTVAIIDPELSVSAPSVLTAHSGADALAHCVESFSAIRRNSEPRIAQERVFVGKSAISDRFALAGIDLLARGLPNAVTNGADMSARCDVALAAAYGGLALGVAGTAGARAIQYPVGALTHTSHGVGVGVLLPYVMEYNLPTRIAEFSQIAQALGRGDGRPTAQNAAAAIDTVAELLAVIGIPSSLDELGVKRKDIDEIVALAQTSVRLIENNPRPLTKAGLRHIVQAAIQGDRKQLSQG